MVDLSINSEKAGSQIIEFLKKTFKEAGFTKLKNLAGGIDLYALEVDSTLPRY